MKTGICRCCGERDLEKILDYGKVALADNFLKEEEIASEKKYPLKLCFCKKCYHVQIDEIINPVVLFEDYVWETGISKTMIEFSENLFEKTDIYSRGKKQKVLEIASNDGTVLSVYKKNKYRVLGVDPAKNIAHIARKRGVETISEFFNLNVAKKILESKGKWDICIARNVIAHVNDLHGFIQGIHLILKKKGFAVIEFPHLEKMYRELQYDQVFHEHIGYHSLHSIIRLFDQYNMTIFNAEKLEVHGGSLRVYLQHEDAQRRVQKNVIKILRSEIDSGIFNKFSWEIYAKRCKAHIESLRAKIANLNNSGYKICIYGASGKGQSLIQMCEINNKLVVGVVDKSSLKQGKYTPGSHVKIHPPEFIYENKVDVILLCTWNLAEENLQQ